MAKMNGSQVCVSAPGKPYVTPTVSLVAPTIATTAAPVPTDVASGVNSRCGRYYHVVVGDYCNMIVVKFKITMADFIFLNPSINANCTNLLADESYCIQAVGDSKPLRVFYPPFPNLIPASRYIQRPRRIQYSSSYARASNWKVQRPAGCNVRFADRYRDSGTFCQWNPGRL